MTHDEALRWCEEHRFQPLPYEYPEHVRPKSGGVGWWVTGWASPKDRNLPDVRIIHLAPTLPECVERARAQYDAVRKGVPLPEKEGGES